MGNVGFRDRTDSAVQNLDLIVLSDDLVCLSQERLKATCLVSLNDQWVVIVMLIIFSEQGFELGLLSLHLQLFRLIHLLQLPLLFFNIVHHVDEVLFGVSFSALGKSASLSLLANDCLALELLSKLRLTLN